MSELTTATRHAASSPKGPHFAAPPKTNAPAVLPTAPPAMPQPTQAAQPQLPQVRQQALREELTELAEVVGPVPLVDLLLERAFQLNATDIHFDPQATGLRVRLRVDGMLHDVLALPAESTAPILSRLKLLANMDITERRATQDGHIHGSQFNRPRDAVSAIDVFREFDVPPMFLASSVRGIVAQRLVRKVCPHCQTTCVPDEALCDLLRVDPSVVSLTRGAGCDACFQTGYLGRTGVFEVLLMTNELRHAILRNKSHTELLDIARSQGLRLLEETTRSKVLAGLTTVEEMLRVLTV